MPNKTKALIAETFLEMTKRKGIDKITVKDVVEACGISRQTFYYHFQDILAVVEWTVEDAVELTVAHSLEAENAEAAIKTFISMAIEHKYLLERLLQSQNREQLETILVRGIQKYLQRMTRHARAAAPAKLHDPEVALDFYSYGIAGLLLKYCGKKDVDVERLSKQISQLFTALKVDDK